jgi:uncharacterized OB-fold protein
MSRTVPAVYPSFETEAWWQATAEGRLLLRHCDACQRVHFYPRSICPLCGSDQTGWVEASGRGTVYSCAVTWRADPPYCIAYIELEEGPIMLSNVVDTDLAAVHIGQAVEVVFKPSASGHAVPMFRPAG